MTKTIMLFFKKDDCETTQVGWKQYKPNCFY